MTDQQKTAERPELGELKVGQQVMVRRSRNGMLRRDATSQFIPAVVTKIGRVWVDLKAAESAPDLQRWMTWRMRMDTQNEATEYSQLDASFATLEQHAWDETLTWARGVLKDQGLRVERDSIWFGREVELADVLSGLD